MRALSFTILVCTACSSGQSGTTGGSTSTTGGSSSTTGGLSCSATPCTVTADCTSCGAGYTCDTTRSFFCCGASGANTPCTSDAQCCSDFCDPNALVCVAVSGGTTTTTTTTTSTATSTATTTATTTSTSTSTAGSSSTSTTTGTSGSSSTSGSAATTATAGGSLGSTSASGSTGGTLGSTGVASSSSSSGGSSGTTGGITYGSFAFTWTFGVSQACEQASAAWVTVAINSGSPVIVPCRDANGVEGVTLDASAAAGIEASYVVTAYDGVLDSQLGQVSGSVLGPLSGTQAVPVTVPLASGQLSALDLEWTFNGLTSTQAAVSSIQVEVTDPKNPVQDVNETFDGGLNGVSLPGFGPAIYPVTLIGNGPATFQATGSLTANGLTPSVFLADLPVSSSGSTGNVVVSFSFSAESCAAAGLDTVALQLSRANGTQLAGPVSLPCASAGTSYVFSNVAAPATAFLWLEGLSQGQTLQLANPQILLSPGATASYTVSAQPSP